MWLDCLWNDLDYSDSRTRRRNHVYGRAGKVFARQEQPEVIKIRFRSDLGFVAILGVLALIGILIRNSVILIVQIEALRNEGRPAWDAVVEATEHRMRPIMLTAAAASLALIPIAREVFWGPMAYAIIGGLFVATLLTLLFLPALYVAWFRIKEPAKERQVDAKEPAHAVAL